jgi:hypothetical protein
MKKPKPGSIRQGLLQRALMAIAFLLVPVPVDAAQGERASEDTVKRALIDGVLARAEAVFSGRMEYGLTILSPGKKPYELDCSLSFSGTSWALRNPGRDKVRISHGGKYISYGSVRQTNGRIDRGASIETARPMDGDSPSPPAFAGTLWHATTRQYIQMHAGQARLGKPRQLDGMQVQVLEWDVPQAQVYEAFHTVFPAASSGGQLRLHVCPELDYALPLIEHLGAGGTPMSIFESKGFKYAAPGVFLPTECSKQDYDGTKKLFNISYTLRRFELINGTIPDDDFRVDLADGTAVADARSNHHFFVGRNTPLPLPNLKDIVVNPVEGGNAWKWWTTSIGAGLAFGLACLVVYSYLRRRKQLSTVQP